MARRYRFQCQEGCRMRDKVVRIRKMVRIGKGFSGGRKEGREFFFFEGKGLNFE